MLLLCHMTNYTSLKTISHLILAKLQPRHLNGNTAATCTYVAKPNEGCITTSKQANKLCNTQFVDFLSKWTDAAQANLVHNDILLYTILFHPTKILPHASPYNGENCLKGWRCCWNLVQQCLHIQAHKNESLQAETPCDPMPKGNAFICVYAPDLTDYFPANCTNTNQFKLVSFPTTSPLPY